MLKQHRYLNNVRACAAKRATWLFFLSLAPTPDAMHGEYGVYTYIAIYITRRRHARDFFVSLSFPYIIYTVLLTRVLASAVVSTTRESAHLQRASLSLSIRSLILSGIKSVGNKILTLC